MLSAYILVLGTYGCALVAWTRPANSSTRFTIFSTNYQMYRKWRAQRHRKTSRTMTIITNPRCPLPIPNQTMIGTQKIGRIDVSTTSENDAESMSDQPILWQSVDWFCIVSPAKKRQNKQAMSKHWNIENKRQEARALSSAGQQIEPSPCVPRRGGIFTRFFLKRAFFAK